MSTKNLKSIEIWQQSYDFDYSCMESTALPLVTLAKSLNSKGICLKASDLNRFFLKGVLYKMSEEQKHKRAQELLDLDYSFLKSTVDNLSYSTAYLGGKALTHLKRDSFKQEFRKYFSSLNAYLKSFEQFKELPNLHEIDESVFLLGFIAHCDSFSYHHSGTFNDYLSYLESNTLSSNKVISISRLNLKNPLFKQFSLSSLSYFLEPRLRPGIKLGQYEKTDLWFKLVIHGVFSFMEQNSKLVA